MKHFLFAFAAFVLALHTYAQDSMKKPKVVTAYNYKQNTHNPNFPFIVSLTTVEYDITINLADPKVIDKYSGLFKRNDIPFTSESWEEVVTGLYDNDSVMHHQVITSAQKDVLRIGTGGAEYQQAFLNYMLPIFTDLQKLELLLKDDE
jgi:hypothetical protein